MVEWIHGLVLSESTVMYHCCMAILVQDPSLSDSQSTGSSHLCTYRYHSCLPSRYSSTRRHVLASTAKGRNQWQESVAVGAELSTMCYRNPSTNRLAYSGRDKRTHAWPDRYGSDTARGSKIGYDSLEAVNVFEQVCAGRWRTHRPHVEIPMLSHLVLELLCGGARTVFESC